VPRVARLHPARRTAPSVTASNGAHMGHFLSVASAVGLAGLGLGALIAPKTSASQFGLPTGDPVAHAFVRAAGARDLVVGLMLFASRDDPPALRRILGFSSLLGLADALCLASQRGLRPQHAVHLGGFLALLLAARSADR
jgi:Domain of unknown function (DUF4267)